LSQNGIAGDVAIAIVDGFEQVDVKDSDRQSASVSFASGNFALKDFMKVSLVVDSRQAVIGHQAIDLFMVRGLQAPALQELKNCPSNLDLVTVFQDSIVTISSFT